MSHRVFFINLFSSLLFKMTRNESCFVAFLICEAQVQKWYSHRSEVNIQLTEEGFQMWERTDQIQVKPHYNAIVHQMNSIEISTTIVQYLCVYLYHLGAMDMQRKTRFSDILKGFITRLTVIQ
jgi:hypothetical protein